MRLGTVRTYYTTVESKGGWRLWETAIIQYFVQSRSTDGDLSLRPPRGTPTITQLSSIAYNHPKQHFNLDALVAIDCPLNLEAVLPAPGVETGGVLAL